MRTIENDERRMLQANGRTPNRQSSGLEMTPSDARLNKLIEDYRAENERCTSKINELKVRLQQQQDDRSNGLTHDKIYSKSFKVSAHNQPRN